MLTEVTIPLTQPPIFLSKTTAEEPWMNQKRDVRKKAKGLERRKESKTMKGQGNGCWKMRTHQRRRETSAIALSSFVFSLSSFGVA